MDNLWPGVPLGGGVAIPLS